MHQPLSQSLAQLLEGDSAATGLTLNRLLERTGGRGIYLVMVILCLPFVVPVSIPGLSTIMGAMIIALAVRLAVGKSPRLPEFFGARVLPPGLRQRVLTGSVRFLRFLERGVRPRRTQWLTWPASRYANSLLIIFMAFLLALPIPPIILFTNSFPSYAIILIAVSMMEEDGLMIWLGYAAALGTVIYFGFWAGLIGHHLTKWLDPLLELIRSMQ